MDHLEFASHEVMGPLHYARWMSEHHPEALGGFYMIEAADLDQAIELAGACPGANWGSIEVRPINERMGA